MISDHGLPSNNQPSSSSAATAGNLANNLSPNLGNNRHPSGSGFDNLAQALQQQANNNNNNNTGMTMAGLESGAFSPLLQGQSWAAMMNTPLMSSFGPNNGGSNADGTFPRLDMSQNGSNNNSSNNAWANSQAAIQVAQAQAAGIVLDDAKKFRRTGRVSDSGLPGAIPSMTNNNNNTNNGGNNNNNNMGGNAAAVAAQQNWRNMNAPHNTNNNSYNNNNGNGNGTNAAGMGSPDLSNLATLQAAMQQMNLAAGNNGGANGMQSPQMAMANLLAAQQQIQQQMQLQQLMAGMNGMNGMGMMGNMQQQQQQMLSPGEPFLHPEVTPL